MQHRPKLVLILLGPTAVGKSSLALFLARRFQGEIINADSMQVYRGFDIGTDKPAAADREEIPHHLLDILDPETQFTAADFARLASEAVRDIHSRRGLPIVVGGTGLYLQALTDGLFPGPGRDRLLRRKLEEEVRDLGVESLHRRLADIDPEYARRITPRDRVRIVRALEVFALTGIPMSRHFLWTKPPLEDFQQARIGLQLERPELNRRIDLRVDRMFERGLVEEVKALMAGGLSRDAPPFRALGYRHVLQFLAAALSLPEAVALTKRDTRQYAKRQMTWFRKMKDIVWFQADDHPAVDDHLRGRRI
ncbi:MAG: tRNA (adenosine(37)-N6)-dimethylallyltransferase MiaA [Candidatus Aminicenantes bacterium RBG_19FT_COMBO_58_17]|nr:MAG: tRNA (adenosine(37)-N6)-dimethylallyltransferase MiaA [Candidatus Aminicenantes bacterium RBG_19FT_COMBO_58_17]